LGFASEHQGRALHPDKQLLAQHHCVQLPHGAGIAASSAAPGSAAVATIDALADPRASPIDIDGKRSPQTIKINAKEAADRRLDDRAARQLLPTEPRLRGPLVGDEQLVVGIATPEQAVVLRACSRTGASR